MLAYHHIDVMVVLQTSMLLSERQRIASLAATTRLPAVYGYREHVDDGGLISYGVDLRACFRRAAYYVHKILNGVAPGDLPIEFPPERLCGFKQPATVPTRVTLARKGAKSRRRITSLRSKATKARTRLIPGPPPVTMTVWSLRPP
jgi:ABC-type uncharacterized transport system substrate-binding protein